MKWASITVVPVWTDATSPDSCTDPSAVNVFILLILSLINNTNGGTEAAAAAAGSGFEQVADQIINLETNLAKVCTHGGSLYVGLRLVFQDGDGFYDF
uniref:Uncharacterized protein n=1 Tax=Amphimedon queenslandica TaxID=400682 RepID=A0A1X7SG37_AMPQE